jgi:PBP1b-binding outer membrane lipoprotein LpoB
LIEEKITGGYMARFIGNKDDLFRNTMKKCLFLAVLAAALVLSGCAKPPQEEIEAAQSAVSRAETDPDVAQYSSGLLTRAREALANMNAEVGAKRYDSAKNYATEAASLAERAITDAKSSATRLRNEAVSSVDSAKSALTQTEDTLNNAKKQRNTGLNFNSLDSDLNAARVNVEAADNANREARYNDAIATAGAARSALSSITTRISQATLATSRKK